VSSPDVNSAVFRRRKIKALLRWKGQLFWGEEDACVIIATCSDNLASDEKDVPREQRNYGAGVRRGRGRMAKKDSLFLA